MYIEGSDLYTYSVTNGEAFPIVLHEGVVLRYWDRNGVLPAQLPPRAVFDGNGSGTCFSLPKVFAIYQSIDPNRFEGYRAYSAVHDPDTNPGFEIRAFSKGVSFLRGASADGRIVLLDGIAFRECRSALFASNEVDGTALLECSRSLFRSPTGSAGTTPDLPQVELECFGSPKLERPVLDVTITSCDLRPEQIDLASSMITLHCSEQGDGHLTIGNTKILAGDPSMASQVIQGAAVEALWQHSSSGSLTLDNCDLRGSGDGVLAEVRTTRVGVAIEADWCEPSDNGLGTIMGGSYLSQFGTNGDLSGSGIHLVASDGGRWSKTNIFHTKASGNHRHGVLAEVFGGESSNRHFDGGIDVRWSLLQNNGLNLGPNDGPGDGIHLDLTPDNLNFSMKNSILRGNHTSGLGGILGYPHPPMVLVHDFTMTNVVMTGNLGISGDSAIPNGEWRTSPLTMRFFSRSGFFPMQSATWHLSHVTIANNATKYAIGVMDETLGETALAVWSANSTVENSVLRENYGAPNFDVSFFPEPDPIIGSTNVFTRMFDSTHYSNLNSEGLTPQQQWLYNTFRGCFYDHPMLVNYIGIGVVFPSAPNSPLIDGGRVPVVSILPKDVVGNPRPVDYPGVSGPSFYDVGAFEVQ